MARSSSGARRLAASAARPPRGAFAGLGVAEPDELDVGLMRPDAATMRFDVSMFGQDPDEGPKLDNPELYADFKGQPKRPAGGIDAIPHGANLAELLSDERLTELGKDLWRELEAADASRAEWRMLASEGVRRLGLDRHLDKRNDPFPGASAVVHPAFAQACVDLQARRAAQLCPPSGPVKTVVVGKQTEAANERADRIAAFMNWQCTEQMEEWRREKERALMMLGVEGSTFLKQWYDPVLKRPRVMYVPADDVIIPYGSADEMTAPIVGERMRKLGDQIDELIDSGAWLEHERGHPNTIARSQVQESTEDVQGVSPHGDSVPSLEHYAYYEIQTRRRIDGLEAGPAEYLITISEYGNKVVSIRRNWVASDPLRQRFRLFHHYRLFPFRGVYGLGFYHLVGGLSIAATGSLRALLDSAHWQTMPGGYRLKQSKVNGSTVVRKPGQYVEVEAAGVRDIREIIMRDPHDGPSPVLYELLGFLSDGVKEFASIALKEVAESNANVPVGTTLARLDEGSRVYSGVYQRQHETQGREFRALYQINVVTIAEQMEIARFDMPDLQEGDFGPGMQVVPVSDPHTHSQVQRSMQHQTRIELGRAAKADGINVDLRSVYVDAAKGMQLQDVEEMFPEDPQPMSGQDPFTENLLFASGKKCVADPAQNHDQHLFLHLQLFRLPGFVGTPAGMGLLENVHQHLALGAATHALMAKKRNEAIDAGEEVDPSEPVDAFQWYASWVDQLAPLMVQPTDPAVERLAAVEEAKTEQRKEEIQAKLDADKQITAVETAAKLKIVDAQNQAKLEEIAANHDQKQLSDAYNLQASRERNATTERVAAANISAKAAEPPRPPPAGPNAVTGKSGAKRKPK